MKDDNMIGKKFGKLLVLERAPKNPNLKSRCIRYTCKCDCGNIVEVNGNSLRTGHTTSCGCKRKLSVPYQDLTNKKFGRLTALYIVGNNSDRRKIWHCKCDCGNEIDVSSHALTSGSRISCGCIKSYKETLINNYLLENKIPFAREFTFADLKGKRNPLRFDFAIFNQKKQLLFLIEYQGEQHYDIKNSWYTEELKNHDDAKKQYCEKNNIPLYFLNKTTNISEELERICNLYEY